MTSDTTDPRTTSRRQFIGTTGAVAAGSLIAGPASAANPQDPKQDPVDTSVMMQSLMQVQISLAIERSDADPNSVADETMKQLRRLLCPPGTSVSAAA